MKKILTLGLLTLLFGAEAMARETPAARNCRINGGQPWTLDVGQVNDLQLCLLGSAQISAQALFAVMTMGQTSEAVDAYAASPIACANADGFIREREDSQGNSFSMCEFADGSALGEATLQAGKNAPQNALLSRLLGF